MKVADIELKALRAQINPHFCKINIWHGISKKQAEGKIWIHIQKEGDMINCIVKDNGIRIHEVNAGKAQMALQKKPGE